jgi:hypothetical protein
MSTASGRTIHVLEQVVKGLPVGTNLALLHLLWSLITGSFLRSRGAIFPALQSCGFTRSASQRSWQAMAQGTWTLSRLVRNWRAYVMGEGLWQANSYEGFRPMAVDMTAFWRPRLKGWPGKFFHGLANRALKGVGFGLLVQVGQVDGHRIPLLKAIIPASFHTDSQATFKQTVLWHAQQHLADDEVAVHDAGASIADMQAIAMPRYVVRLAKNCTARRNRLSNHQRGRPAEYGQIVRPLARQHLAKTIPASAPDEETEFTYQGRTIQVQGWHGLVRKDQKVCPTHKTFSIWVYFDPLFRDPLVVGANISALPCTLFRIYLDRWPVEQVPLVAKQTLGLHRHFVWALLSCLRLPALALLVANVLTYLATTLPPLPTGFWDRQPKKRQVASVVSWPRRIFHMITLWMANFVKSNPTQAIFLKDLRPAGRQNHRFDLIPATQSLFFIRCCRPTVWLRFQPVTFGCLSLPTVSQN